MYVSRLSFLTLTKEIGTLCPNSKSICKTFAKILQKVVATKYAKSLQNFCKIFATAHFAKRFAI